MKHESIIFLKHCSSYRVEELRPNVSLLLEALTGDMTLPGRVVLLKPNLISSRGRSLACTSGEIIAEVARYFVDCGARVRIGDSPAFGTTHSVMECHGMTHLLAGLPVELVRFSTPVVQVLAQGEEVQVAREALECDLLVNLPRLKAHNQLYFTGAVKNFFGTIVGIRKALIHMRSGQSHYRFGSLLLALTKLFPDQLSLMDAIEVMHRSGPMDGEKLHVGYLAASSCPVALDTALLHILGLDHTRSPIWRAAHAHNHPGSTMDGKVFPFDDLRDCLHQGFVAPESLNPVRFSLFRLLIGAGRRMMLAIRR